MNTLNVEISKTELEAINDMVEDIEATIGCSEPLDDESSDWDTEMQKRIKKIRRFFRRNRLEFI